MIDLIPNSQAVQYQVLEMYLYIPSGTSYFNNNLVSSTQHNLVFIFISQLSLNPVCCFMLVTSSLFDKCTIVIY